MIAEVQSAAHGTWRLWGDYALADPPFLVLIPVGLALYLYGRGRRGRARARASSLPPVVARSWRQRLSIAAPLLHVSSMALAVIAMARPLREGVVHDVISEGVDIALVVDRSGSMRFDDLEAEKTRLEVVKDVVGEFAARRMTDREGAADHCALIAFARYPQLLCPFTLDVGALQGFLDKVEVAQGNEEDGTAIGTALAKAVATLKDSEAKSRVVVLLTDGETTVFDILPMKAAELAAEEGVRVYTVYAARNVYEFDPFAGGWRVNAQATAPTEELRQIAELTGGQAYQASNRADLQRIYADIEKLERTERREERYEESYDLYLRFLLSALALYGLAWISSSTWARRIA